MKPTLRFLSYCLVLAAALLCTQLQADFLVDLHINGAENPSLSFGEAAIAKENPFPPFSAMFGVADVCFAGKEDAPQYFDRLADDIRSGSDNAWTLVAKTNARVTWKKKNNNIPANLKIVWKDIKNGEFKEADITDNASLSLKAGTTYLIKQGEASEDDLNEIPDDTSTGYARKVDGEMQPVVFNLDALEEITLRLRVNTGKDIVCYPDDPRIDDASWEIIFNTSAGYAVDYEWDESEPNILIVTITKNDPGTRSDSEWNLTLLPHKSSAAPLTIGNAEDNENFPRELQAILLKFGTLDFDGDGLVTLDDATYFYNFMSFGGIKNPRITPTTIMGFIENPNEEKASIALDYFLNNIDENNFDDSASGTLLDDATYFYNFMTLGGVQNPRISAGVLMTFTEDAKEEDAEIALGKLKELATE